MASSTRHTTPHNDSAKGKANPKAKPKPNGAAWFTAATSPAADVESRHATRTSSIYPPLPTTTPTAIASRSRSGSVYPYLPPFPRGDATAPTPPPAGPPTTSRRSSKPRSMPKTWESTAASRFSSRSYSSWTASDSRNSSEAAKEAERTALESHLDYYTYLSPVTSSLSPDEAFLRPNRTDDAISSTKRLSPPSIAYITNLAQANHLLRRLPPSLPLALDLEWNFTRTGKVYKTALLQLASPSLVLLVHLSSIKTVPPALLPILSDPHRIKTGVAIRNDALKLQRDFGIVSRGLVELSTVARTVDGESWKGRRAGLISLRDLTRVYTGRKLRKDSVRCSDWTRTPLSEQQIEYASNDVVVSLEILRVLVARIKGKGDEMQNVLNMARVDVDPFLPSTATKTTTTTTTTTRKPLRSIPLNLLPSSPSPSTTSSPSSPTSSTAPSSSKPEIILTSITLAHTRALRLFLSPSSLSLPQISTTLNIKLTTAAAYLYRAILESRRNGQDVMNERDWHRLDKQLADAGKVLGGTRMRVARVRRGSFPPPSGGQAVVPATIGPAKVDVKQQQQQRNDDIATRQTSADEDNVVASVVDDDWEEVDVVEPSR